MVRTCATWSGQFRKLWIYLNWGNRRTVIQFISWRHASEVWALFGWLFDPAFWLYCVNLFYRFFLTFFSRVVLEPRDATSKGTQRLLKIQGLVTENERMHLDDLRESYGLTDGESEHLPSLFCNNRLDMDAINYIVSCVSPVFKEAVQEEKEALAGFVSGSIKTALKCVPNGFRENCDVCETAVFDVHYVCHFCGFSVCLACKKERDARDTSRNGCKKHFSMASMFKSHTVTG